jgi:hypothetical protein
MIKLSNSPREFAVRLERYIGLRRGGMTKVDAWIELGIDNPSTRYRYEHWWQHQARKEAEVPPS